MSVGIGFAYDGRAYIGADSALTNQSMDVMVLSEPKVFDSGEFLGCYSGSMAVALIVIDALNQAGSRDMLQIASMVRARLKEAELYKDIFQAILARKKTSELYIMDNEICIASPLDGYCAIGLGSQAALGAIHMAMEVMEQVDPERIIRLAMEASAANNASVKEPFGIISS
jgi:ATP-dependent protease HslVU (ClpYQ) peptidase subunit